MCVKALPIAFWLTLFCLLHSAQAASPTLPPPPTKDIYLADFAQMVEPAEGQTILAIGKELDERFGAQLVVVSVPSLGGMDIEGYANTLFRSWGIGDAKKNNGVLLLIAQEERKFRIEVGYGLEGAITDGYAGEILDSMVPYFKDVQYSLGILSAYKQLAARIYKEHTENIPESLQVQTKKDEDLTLSDYVYIALGIFVFFLLAVPIFLLFEPISDFISDIIASTILYILNVLLFICTFGHYGSLKVDECFKSDTKRSRSRGSHSSGSSSSWSTSSSSSRSTSSSSSRSSSSRSSSSSGYRGGSSGGGGASGGW